jgi:hypothetical protein
MVCQKFLPLIRVRGDKKKKFGNGYIKVKVSGLPLASLGCMKKGNVGRALPAKQF